jgi:hypothetical protein
MDETKRLTIRNMANEFIKHSDISDNIDFFEEQLGQWDSLELKIILCREYETKGKEILIPQSFQTHLKDFIENYRDAINRELTDLEYGLNYNTEHRPLSVPQKEIEKCKP